MDLYGEMVPVTAPLGGWGGRDRVRWGPKDRNADAGTEDGVVGAGRPGSSPFSAPTETAPARCLSSSEAEEVVQEEEEVHLRLVVLGRLQLSRYLRKHQRT